MLAIALVVPNFPDHVRSDTYSIDYGRICGLTATTPTTTDLLLADAADKLALVTRLARSRPNSSQWRAAARASREAIIAYSAAKGLSREDALARIHQVAARRKQF